MARSLYQNLRSHSWFAGPMHLALGDAITTVAATVAVAVLALAATVALVAAAVVVWRTCMNSSLAPRVITLLLRAHIFLVVLLALL